MPQIEDETGNQNQFDVDHSGEQDNTGDSGNQDDQDFLVVNDRTRFKTQDDAIKSFNEAGETIARLSGWDKELGRYGVTDPREAAQLFDELVELRKLKAESEKAAKAQGGKQETHTDDEEALTKEEIEARNWLKKVLPKMGYIPKAELESTKAALEAQIAELKEGSETNSQAAFEERKTEFVASGRENVLGWMAEQKIVDDSEGNKMLALEGMIRDWVNQDDNRVRKFYESAASSKAIVKEGFDRAIKVLGWSKSAGGSASSASYSQSKGSSLARNGKRLPQNGVSSRQQQQPQVRTDAGGRKDHIGSAHDKAWEIASKHFAGTSAE